MNFNGHLHRQLCLKFIEKILMAYLYPSAILTVVERLWLMQNLCSFYTGRPYKEWSISPYHKVLPSSWRSYFFFAQDDVMEMVEYETASHLGMVVLDESWWIGIFWG